MADEGVECGATCAAPLKLVGAQGAYDLHECPNGHGRSHMQRGTGQVPCGALMKYDHTTGESDFYDCPAAHGRTYVPKGTPAHYVKCPTMTVKCAAACAAAMTYTCNLGSRMRWDCPKGHGYVFLERSKTAPVQQGVVQAQGLDQVDLRPKGAPGELEVVREDPSKPDGKTDAEFSENQEQATEQANN